MLLRCFGILVELFYRLTHLGGSVPKSGPVILVANHPNGMVDPVVVGRFAQRNLHILAKEPVFRIPIIGQLTRVAGGIPVYRAQDGHQTSQNKGMFDAVYSVLTRGEAVLLFPEGISHSEPGLQNLKTGAARMALGTEALAGMPAGVKIVPVGITYRDKARFGSSVALEIGDAIDVAPWSEEWAQDERRAARSLTHAIEEGLRKVMLDLEEWEDLPRLQLLQSLFPQQEDHLVQRMRSLAEQGKQGGVQLKDLNSIRKKIDQLRRKLHWLGMEGTDLQASIGLKNVATFIGRNLIGLLAGFPAALAGGILWAVPWAAVRVTLKLKRPSEDLQATFKFVGILLFFSTWSLVLVYLGWKSFGLGPALAILSVGAMLGLWARHFLSLRERAWREARSFVLFFSRRRFRAKLEADKNELRDYVLEFGRKHLSS